MFLMLQFLIATFRKTFRDCFTSSNGDFDPARVFGYGFVILSGTVFLVLTVYETIQTKAFDTVEFSYGVVAISGAIAAAASGVLIKKSAETPLDTATSVATTIDKTGAITTNTTTTDLPTPGKS